MKRIVVVALLIVAGALQLGSGAGGPARAEREAVAAEPPYNGPAPVAERAGGISGHVLSTHGQDTADLRVELLSAGGELLRSARSDDAGGFGLYPLDAGRYHLRVLDQRGLLLTVENPEALDFALLDGQSLTIDLRLSAAPPKAAPALAPVSVAASYQITGVVTATGSGLPLANVEVDAYTADGFAPYSAGTDAQGVYQMSNVVPGSYKLQFSSGPGSPAYVSQWYSNKTDFSSATAVVVVAGATTGGVNASLAVGGWITGTVTAADSGLPLPTGGGAVQVLDASGALAAYGIRDVSGNYSTTGLRSGSYWVRFSPPSSVPYLPIYYNNKATLAGGDPVAVTAPNVTPHIDGALPRGAQLTGHVTASDSALPLQNAGVGVYDCSGHFWTSAGTDATGAYTTTRGLPSGPYRVSFSSPSPLYAGQAYNHRPDLGSADVVMLSAPGVRANIDAVLDVSVVGQITGTVTAAGGGLPVSNVTVVLRDNKGASLQGTFTDANGNYVFSGLPTATYYVQFASSDYVGQYYSNRVDLTTTDLVTVNAPGTAGGVDAVLQTGAHIAGMVSDGANPLSNVRVRVYDNGGHAVGGATTSSGFYQTSRLITGTYRLLFMPPLSPNSQPGDPWNDGFQYYNNKLAFAAADGVVVAPPTDTSGIDATLQPGGHIAVGITRSAQGQAYVYFNVYNSSGHLVAYNFGSFSGVYVIPAVPSGSYRVQFDASQVAPACSGPYISDYYNHKPDWASADTVNVSAPNTTLIDVTVLFRGLLLPAIVR